MKCLHNLFGNVQSNLCICRKEDGNIDGVTYRDSNKACFCEVGMTRANGKKEWTSKKIPGKEKSKYSLPITLFC